jgi:flagellar FliL protein
MSDNDELDLDGGDSAGLEGSAKKSSGLGALLPNILKFVAIGLGAVIFIITVTFITVQFVTKRGRAQSATADPTSPYQGKRTDYSMYTLIGPVTTRTRDPNAFTITVDMIIAYDLNDNAAQTELTSRQYELRDFVRRYFTSKYAEELQPENEAQRKQDIKEILNTRFLDKAKARMILFNKLDLMEGY